MPMRLTVRLSMQVIVESGSPQGFELVHEAREYLLEAVTIVAA